MWIHTKVTFGVQNKVIQIIAERKYTSDTSAELNGSIFGFDRDMMSL